MMFLKRSVDVREKLVQIIQNSVGGCARHWAEVIADGLIANGVTIQEWIPVTERLPEVRVPVLTYGRKGAVGIGFIQPTSVTPDGKVYFYARYGDNLPTHWMPLPEMPKEE